MAGGNNIMRNGSADAEATRVKGTVEASMEFETRMMTVTENTKKGKQEHQ